MKTIIVIVIIAAIILVGVIFYPMTYQTDDMVDLSAIYWTALCVYHEARSESAEAQIAVAHVIFNRADQMQTEDIAQVIFQPYQFSWANGGNRPPIIEYHSLHAAILNVEECLRRRQAGDRFEGRTFFRDDSMRPPDEAVNLIRIDRLMFYSL